MTLTEALAPYTIKGAGGDLPITSDRVQVEYDVTGGTKRLRHVVVQVGGDKFLRIDSIPEGSGQQMWLEFEGGGDNFHLMLEVTPQLAHDTASPPSPVRWGPWSSITLSDHVAALRRIAISRH